MIAEYLPEQLTDDEIAALVHRGDRRRSVSAGEGMRAWAR